MDHHYLSLVSDDPKSGIKALTKSVTVVLSSLNEVTIKENLSKMLSRNLNKYSPDIGGILLGYNSNIRYSKVNFHRGSDGIVTLKVTAKFYLFSPSVGSILRCTVKDRSPDQINCLALNHFPVTIYNPDAAWASVSCGDQVQVEVQVVSQVANSDPVIIGVIRHNEPIMQELINIDAEEDDHGSPDLLKTLQFCEDVGLDVDLYVELSKNNDEEAKESSLDTSSSSSEDEHDTSIKESVEESSSDSSSSSGEEEEEKPVEKKVSQKKSIAKPGVNPKRALESSSDSSSDEEEEEEKLFSPKKSLVKPGISPKKAYKNAVFQSSSGSDFVDEATAVNKDESSYEGDSDGYTGFQASLKKKLSEKKKVESSSSSASDSESDSDEESSIEAKKKTEPPKKVDKRNRGDAANAEDTEEDDEDLEPSKSSMKPRTSDKKQPRSRRCLLPSFLSTKKKFPLPKVTSPVLKKSKSDSSKASKSSKVGSDEALSKPMPESFSLNAGARDQNERHNEAVLKAVLKVKRNLSFYL